MDRFSKTLMHKGTPIKVDVGRTPNGQMQMDISGPKSRLSYTGTPEGAQALARRLLNKAGGAAKKPDADKR